MGGLTGLTGGLIGGLTGGLTLGGLTGLTGLTLSAVKKNTDYKLAKSSLSQMRTRCSVPRKRRLVRRKVQLGKGRGTN